VSAPLHTGESYGEAGLASVVSVHVGYQVDPNRIGVWITRRTSRSVWNLEASENGAVWTARHDGEYRPPFLHLREEDAQTMLEGLWRAGVRTPESMASGAHRSTLEGHLADMRELVAHFAKVPLSGTKGKT